MYTHNLVSRLLGYVFAWNRLDGFEDWKGREDGLNDGVQHSASELGKIAQQLMMDPEALAIPDV